VYSCNLSIEAEEGKLRQPGLYQDPVSKNKTQKLKIGFFQPRQEFRASKGVWPLDYGLLILDFASRQRK
jgi:hypothetical protein